MPKVKGTFPKSVPAPPTAPSPPPIKAPWPQQKLMAALYKPLNAERSSIFRGVCFFNLNCNCKKAHCHYKHIKLNDVEVQNRLTKTSEPKFVQEYMLLRGFPDLRRMYGLYYVQECLKRELTRILVEMSIDFIARALTDKDEELKVVVTEQVMLHLDKVDLNKCDDLLLYRLGPQKLLCDFFMETLAETFDFSRFKQIFIRLAQFIVEKGKRFDSTVVKRLLERVCISVYEEQVSTILILMIKNTDKGIFDMMDPLEFEIYLLTNGAQELYAEISAFRVQSTVADVCQEMDMKLVLSNQELCTVPDAMKLENLNKKPVPSSSDSEEHRLKKPNNRHWWQHQVNMIVNAPRIPRPLLRKSKLKRLLDGPCMHPKFPRRSAHR